MESAFENLMGFLHLSQWRVDVNTPVKLSRDAVRSNYHSILLNRMCSEMFVDKLTPCLTARLCWLLAVPFLVFFHYSFGTAVEQLIRRVMLGFEVITVPRRLHGYCFYLFAIYVYVQWWPKVWHHHCNILFLYIREQFEERCLALAQVWGWHN